MGNNKKKRGRLVAGILIVLLLIGGLAAVYLRVNPTWKAAELKVEQGGRYAELDGTDPAGMTVETRFIPPEGYSRAAAEAGSFAEYLRGYPLFPAGTKLPVYDGTSMDSAYAAAVFDISVWGRRLSAVR